MKKIFLSLMLVILTLSQGLSQTWFREDYGELMAIRPRFQAIDRNIISVAFHNDEILIMKLSEETGEIMWNSSYAASSYSEPTGAIEIADGKILIVGYDNPSGSPKGRNYVLLLDSNGQKITDTTWTTTGLSESRIRKILATDLDSVFILLGSGLSDTQIYSSFLTKICFKNEKIIVLLEKVFPDFLPCSICKNEDRYIVSETCLSLLQTTVMEVDENFEVKWEKNYPFSPRLVSNRIIPVIDGYVFAGYFMGVTAGIAKIGLDGTLIWINEYMNEGTSSGIVKGIWESNGLIKAMIRVNGATESAQTFLVEISPDDGSILWQKQWRIGYYTYDAILLNDGMVVLGGDKRTHYPFKGWAARESFARTEIESIKNLPSEFRITNYPNPFNTSTKIEFDLQKEEKVKISIYDLFGHEIWKQEKYCNVGNNSVIWDGTNCSGQTVSTGVYLVQVVLKNFIATQKVLLMK